MFGMRSISQQGSRWKELTNGFGHASEAAFTMRGNPNKVISTDNSRN